jgi:hypothetical protein
METPLMVVYWMGCAMGEMLNLRDHLKEYDRRTIDECCKNAIRALELMREAVSEGA